MPPAYYNQSSRAGSTGAAGCRRESAAVGREPAPIDWSASELRGVLERIVWPKPSDEPSRDGMVIARLRSGASVKGSLFAPALGQEYVFSGRWEEGRVGRDGRQFDPTFVFRDALALQPTTSDGVHEYLVAHCKWVKHATARAIVEAFGANNALQICKTDPDRVAAAVRGITPERAREIRADLVSRQELEAVEVAVRGIVAAVPEPGVTTRQLRAILVKYAGESAEVLKREPYKLIEHIEGIGWKTADAIGRAVGIESADPARLRAGILHAIQAAEDEGGHTCVRRGELVASAVGLLLVDMDVVAGRLDAMRDAGELVEHVDRVDGDGDNGSSSGSDTYIFRRAMWAAESTVSAAFLRLLGPERIVPRRPVEPRAPSLDEADRLALEYEAYAKSADGSAARAASSASTPHPSVVTAGASHTRARKAGTPLEAWAADALCWLAAADADHAQARNSEGFSKSDGPRGHRWARALAGTGGELLEREWEAAVRLACKYRRQVGAPPVAAWTPEAEHE